MNKKGIKKYLPGAESLATSFGDKAGAAMGTYGGAIGSAASSLMPLLMKKPDPNAKPYKKGSKLIKYEEGTKKTIVSDPNDPENFKRRAKQSQITEDANSARNTYEARLAGESSRDAYEKQQAAGLNLLNTTGPRVTENNNTNMDNSRFEKMMSSDIRKSSTGLTPSPAYGTTSSAAKKPAMRQKPVMTAEMKRVAALQQKMKAAGYNIKVDGAWGNETQKIYNAYNKDRASDNSRKNTVNTGQGPTIQSQRNLTPAMQGKVLPEVTVTAPAKNTYNPLDSPVLRQAAKDTQVRMSKEQAIVDAKAKAKQAKITRNEKSLPSATESNRLTFNASDKGQGQDFTTAQDNALKQNKLVGDGATSKNSTRVETFDFGTSAIKAIKFFGGNTSNAVPKMPSKIGKSMSGASMVAKNKSIANNFKPPTPIKPAMPVDNRPGMEAIRNYRSKMPGIGLPNMPKPIRGLEAPIKATPKKLGGMSAIKPVIRKGTMPLNIPSPTMPKAFANGTKKLSGYSKLDSKLGGLLPGGVTRAEAKTLKTERQNEKKLITLREDAEGARKNYETRLDAEDARKTYEARLAGESARDAYEAQQKQAPSKSLKTQYEENKGGYSRALKSGKKDSSGNLVDPSTGLAYKQLPARTGGGAGGSGKGGSKPATTAPKGNSLFKNGVAVKNFKDKNTGITYYTNGRAFNEKTGKMAKYAHNPKSNKIGLQFDKAKAAPVKKRKGDDTYMDEVIDTGSRIAGSIGGGLLAGGTTLGVGSVAGAVAGDYAGKRFGNWLNKKLGYREEDDISQEGYSLKEGALAGVGGAAGKLIKFAAPVVGKVGGAIVSRGGKELAKVSGAPLGRALSSVAKSKAGQVVGNVASKAKNLVSRGGGSNTAAAQTTSKVASKVNAPGAISKVAPTAQSSRAVGKIGPLPTKAVRGTRGRFTKNPAKAPLKANSTVNPKQLLTKRGATSSVNAKPTVTAQGAVQGPAKANLSQGISNKAKTAGRKTKEVGKKAINFVKNNKKKTAVGAVGGAGLVGGGYALSKTRTGE
jgi:hypothetical protein